MRPFSHRDDPLRVAAFATFEFPSPKGLPVYEMMDAVAGRLSAAVRFFHDSVPDPAGLPRALKARLGSGVLVPWPSEAECGLDANLEHFQLTVPERFAHVQEVWSAVAGEPIATLFAKAETRASFAFCRQVQAWAPDVLLATTVNRHALHALVASRLLDIPLVAWIPSGWMDDEAEMLARQILQTADVLLIESDDAMQILERRFGKPGRGSWRIIGPLARGALAIAAILAELGRKERPATAPVLGPKAAFACSYHPPVAAIPDVQPMLVLGAERTGSNLLVDVLSSQRVIACAGELFNPRAIEGNEITWLPGFDYTPDLPELLALRQQPAQLIGRLQQDAPRAQATCVGFKLLYYHAALDNRVVAALQGLPDLKVVHLLRRARLRRWLSHYKALQMDTWYVPVGGGVQSRLGPVELDPKATVIDFLYTEMLEDRYRATFADFEVLELDYDDFTGDFDGTRGLLEQFFGMQFDALRPASEKTGESLLADGIANLEALRDAFAGTRFADQFAEA